MDYHETPPQPAATPSTELRLAILQELVEELSASAATHVELDDWGLAEPVSVVALREECERQKRQLQHWRVQSN